MMLRHRVRGEAIVVIRIRHSREYRPDAGQVPRVRLDRRQMAVRNDPLVVDPLAG